MAIISQDLLASTLEKLSPVIEDLMPRKSPVMNHIKTRGNAKEVAYSGLRYRMALEVELNPNLMFFSGAEQWRIDRNEFLNHCYANIRSMVGTITTEGLEEVINSGPEAVHNLMKAKAKNLAKSFQMLMAQSWYYDGTEFNGKAFTGSQQFIVSDPSAGVVEGLDRATVKDRQGRFYWRNQTLFLNALPATTAASPNVRTMTRGLNRIHLPVKNGDDKPDMGIMGDGHYTDYLEELQEKVMFTEAKPSEAGFGFTGLRYGPLALNIVNDSISPNPRMTQLVNTQYLHMLKAKGRWMKDLPTGRPLNQDVSAESTVAYGNIAISNMERQGLMLDAA